MEKTFLRIIFWVFPFIFFHLVDFSIHSNLAENNHTWSFNEKKYVIKTNSISKNNTSNNLSGDGILHLKLKGRLLSGCRKQQEMNAFIKRFQGVLNKKRGELEKINKELDIFQTSVGDSLSHLVLGGWQCSICAGKKYPHKVACSNCNECKERLNEFFEECEYFGKYIIKAKSMIHGIYTEVSSLHKELTGNITDKGEINDNACNDYNSLMRDFNKVLDLIFNNKSKCENIIDYVRFISQQACLEEGANKIQSILQEYHRLQPLNVETSVLDKIFNVKVISFCALGVFLISGIAIYYFLQKKQ